MRAFLGFFIIKAVLLCLPFCVQAQTPLSADQAVQDTRVLKTTLAALHPGLTKYQTSVQMDAAFARFEARGNAARSAPEIGRQRIRHAINGYQVFHRARTH